MANIFDIPILAPIRFFRQSELTLNISSALLGAFNPSYNSKQFDADFYQRTLQDYEDEGIYIQQFQNCDNIRFNFIGSDTTASNYVLRMLDCMGRAYPLTASTIAQNNSTAITGGKLYDYNIPLYNIPEGKYFLQIQHIQTGDDLYMISEPFHVKELHDNTVLLKYWNSYNDQGVMFTTDSIKMSIRIPGALRELTTGSKFFVYEDQPLNAEMISGKPYRSFKLIAGGRDMAVPEYIVDKLERITLCDSLMIDGKYYTREEGSKLEKQEVRLNPLAYYTLSMRERYNESSIEVQEVESVVMGTMPQTDAFFVKEITLATTTYSVQKMFTGKVNFLAYLNTTSFTSSILTDGYFAESNDSLIFVKYDAFTISGTWELASNDVLLYGIHMIVDTSFGVDFECTLSGTGNYAVSSGLSGKYITTTNLTAFTPNVTIAVTYTSTKLYDFYVFFDTCVEFTCNSEDPSAVYLGGQFAPDLDTIDASNTNLNRIGNTLFDYVNSDAVVSIDLSGCKIPTGQINKLIMTLYDAAKADAFDSTCVIDISGQTPSAPPTDNDNLNVLKSYISSQITTFTTD